jgi:uncharacterized repeat protein (TIGR01451 family)
MKKALHLTFPVLLLFLSFTSHAIKNHIKAHLVLDSCGKGLYIINVIDTPASGLHLEVSWGDGTIDTTNVKTTPPYYTYSTFHDYTSVGTYTISEVVLDTSARIDSISFSSLYQRCGYIWGTVYHDIDNNCSFDPAKDLWITPGWSIEVDSGGVAIDTLWASARYMYTPHSFGTAFTFKVISTPSGFTASCPSSHSYTVTSAPTWVQGGDFGFSCITSGFDVSLSSWSCASPYLYGAEAIARTNTCAPQSGTVIIHMDPRYPHVVYSAPGATVSGNTISWSYSGLTNDNDLSFYVIAHADSSALATVGSLDTTTMVITPIAGDPDTTNNHYIATDVVKSSWDPNDKQVAPTGTIPAGATLTYTIHFENTGNAPATNINVQDTLSDNLDVLSLQIIASSAPINVYNSNVGGKNIIKFDFPNINLPDTSYHGQADGLVQFSIKTKTALTPGTTIDNRAGIYFDGNPVVMTNSVENTIKTTAVPTLGNFGQVVVYPNPVHDDLTIKTNNGDYNNVSIINYLGQTLIQKTIQGPVNHVDMSHLSPGIYYILLKGSAGVNVQKLEKL